jgi:threonyl-tRNA synthetase
MLRVRAFHQDDAHIFCREEQINAEALAFCELLKTVYKDLGFTDIHVKFSDRPATRAGEDADWDKAEAALKEAALAAGLTFTLNPGEGAFYGPKLEFALRDALGRDWQCGTIQCDFVLPKRLGATYVAEDGSKQHPVMLHRAIVGSLERFLGILIEHTAGHLPLWLSPVPVVIATITDEAKEYAEELAAALREQEIGVTVDSRNEKINYKVREHSLTKTPFIWAVGKNEVAQQTVAVRRLGAEGQQVLAKVEAIAQLQTATAIP